MIRGLRSVRVASSACLVLVIGGCSWEGPNSLSLPGGEGRGDGAYTVTVDLPDVSNIEPNTRVRVDDVDIGRVTSVQAVNWVARVTLSLNGDVTLPANTTAKVGQTSLLGSNHLELARPTDAQPEGRLSDGDTISLDRTGAYPTTEKTLASLATVLNGGGLGQVQEITTELNKALNGRQGALRDLLTHIDTATGELNRQRDDIITATTSLDELAGQLARDRDTLATAIDSIGPALDVLNSQRDKLIAALASLERLSTTATALADASRDDLVVELRDARAVFTSLTASGESLNKALPTAPVFPVTLDVIDQVVRGDAANVVGVIDLTLSRLDTSFLTNTPAEGTLTGLEAALGRTIGVPPNLPTRNPFLLPVAAAGVAIPDAPGALPPGLPPLGGER